MGWDRNRPVPWQRLMRDWVLYASIISVVFLVFFRDDGVTGAIAGVLISGPIFLAFGAVLAKFGYQRRTIKELRTEQATRAEREATESSATSATGDRTPRPSRPAPTRRTSTGPNRPKRRRRR